MQIVRMIKQINNNNFNNKLKMQEQQINKNIFKSIQNDQYCSLKLKFYDSKSKFTDDSRKLIKNNINSESNIYQQNKKAKKYSKKGQETSQKGQNMSRCQFLSMKNSRIIKKQEQMKQKNEQQKINRFRTFTKRKKDKLMCHNTQPQITQESMFQYYLKSKKNKYPELQTLFQKLKTQNNKQYKQVSSQTKNYQSQLSFFNTSQNITKQISIQTDHQIKKTSLLNFNNPNIKNQLKNIQFPILPHPPHQATTPKQLIQLGRKLFQIFKISQFKNQHPLTAEKYRNCIHYTTQGAHILWYNTGRFYIGEYKKINNQGIKHGYGIQLIPQKSIYEGQFAFNKKSGLGTLKFENGNYYIGQFSNGLQQGKGKLYSINRLIYDGQWKKGNMDGTGKLYLTEQQIYEGGLKEGNQNGYGIMKLKNGDIYKGNFFDGKFQGLGTYIWVNGEIYKGQFQQGYRHGNGIWRSAPKSGIYQEYIGEYRFDKKSGKGRYVWKEKCEYEGEFEDDKRHGIGLMKNDDNVVKGIWKNGLLQKILWESLKNEQKSRDNKRLERSIEQKQQRLMNKVLVNRNVVRICGCKSKQRDEQRREVRLNRIYLRNKSLCNEQNRRNRIKLHEEPYRQMMVTKKVNRINS